MRTPGKPEELERQRFRAIALLNAGHRPGKVATMLGVSPGAVSRWKKVCQHAGLEGLKAKPCLGPKPRLTMAQRQELERLLLKGPCAQGYPTARWTLRRIDEAIEKHFGVRYHLSSVAHLLDSMGWNWQKSGRRARERNEEAVVGWQQQGGPKNAQ